MCLSFVEPLIKRANHKCVFSTKLYLCVCVTVSMSQCVYFMCGCTCHHLQVCNMFFVTFKYWLSEFYRAMYGLMFWEGLRVQKTKPRSLSPQKPVLVLFTVCHHRARTKNGARKEDQRRGSPTIKSKDENWTKEFWYFMVLSYIDSVEVILSDWSDTGVGTTENIQNFPNISSIF